MSATLTAIPAGHASPPERATRAACAPSTVILSSPREGSREVQAKALNDRGDVVGFADSTEPGQEAIHAILWRNGRVRSAVDLGVPPGYVASEAYGINNRRVVFGLAYDAQERAFPFRWAAGRWTVLKGPDGRRHPVDVPDHNTLNERGEMAGTMLIAGRRVAVRWSAGGVATVLAPLPGHAWTNVWSINDDGVVAGWSRREPNEDGENNPVLWDADGAVIALQTVPGMADGAAFATNGAGLTVGYLGNLGTDGQPGVPNTDPERDRAVVWESPTAVPRVLGRPARPHDYAALVDVNDRGQAAGMAGRFTSTGFARFRPMIWRHGLGEPAPAAGAGRTPSEPRWWSRT